MKLKSPRLLFVATVLCFLQSANVYAGTENLSGIDLLSGKTTFISPKEKGTVLVFLSAKCPCSHSHTEILKNLSSEFRYFAFYAVHSNSDEPQELAKSYFKALDLNFPILNDQSGFLADKFKALKTPHAFVLSPRGEIIYKGGVTNSSDGKSARVHFLKEVLTDINSNKPPRIFEGRTLGCVISRGEKNVW